jgi:uncharacterized protein YndB with AHSA1/START domain
MGSDPAVAEISRRLAASPARVFAAFADATLVGRWLTPSPEVRLTILEFEFRVGGKYRFAYHVPGGAIMIVNGIYRSIEPTSKIVFSWNIEPPDEHAGTESEVIVTIRSLGRGCELHIRHERLTRAGAVERHRDGWRGAINLLTSLMEGAALSRDP